MATRKRKTCKRGRRKGTRSCRRKPGPKRGRRKTCKRGRRKGTHSCRRKPGPKRGRRSKRRKRKSKFRMYSKKRKIQCNNNYLVVGDIESCKAKTSPLFCHPEFYNYLDRKLETERNLKVIFIGDYFDKGEERYMINVIRGICKLLYHHNLKQRFPDNMSMNDLIKFMYTQAKLCYVEGINESNDNKVIVIFGNRDINKLRLLYELSDFGNIQSLLYGVKDLLSPNRTNFLVEIDNSNNIRHRSKPKNNIFISHSSISGLAKKDSFSKFGVNNSASIHTFVKQLNNRFQKYVQKCLKHWGVCTVNPPIDFDNSMWDTITELPKPWNTADRKTGETILDKVKKSKDNKIYTWFQNTMGLNPIKGSDPGSSYLLKYFCPRDIGLRPPVDHSLFQTLALGDNFVIDRNYRTPSMVTSSIVGCNTPQDLSEHRSIEGFCNKHGLKALVAGHKPVCFPIPLFYNHDNSTFIFSDLTQDNVLKVGNDYITPVGIYSPCNDSFDLNFLKQDASSPGMLLQKPISNKYGEINNKSLQELNNYYMKPFLMTDAGHLQSIDTLSGKMTIIPGPGSRDKRTAEFDFGLY